MSPLHSTRSGFDRYSYWIAFIFVSCFVTYFLTSMIRLAYQEDNNNNIAITQSYQAQNSLIKAQRSQSEGIMIRDYMGNVTNLE